MPRTDAHFHVGLCGFTAEDIINQLNRKNIEKCWLLTWEEKLPPVPRLYQHLSLDELMNACDKYPDRLIPFYAPDPKAENCGQVLRELKAKGIKGCGELKVAYKWADPAIENYLQILSDLGMPLVFHMESPRDQYLNKSEKGLEKLFGMLMNGAFNGLTRYYLHKSSKYVPFLAKKISENSTYFPGYLYDFDWLEKRLIQFPGINFIAHGPHFWNNINLFQSPKYVHQSGRIRNWGIIDRLLEEHANFYCDLSGKSGFNALSRDRKQAKCFLEKHSHKIIYGTDNTLYDFDGLLSSYRLPKEMMENIFYNNARKVMG